MSEPMRHDPAKIVNEMVQEHGLDRAIEIATEGIVTAQQNGDLYALSICREVRSLLRTRQQAATGPIV